MIKNIENKKIKMSIKEEKVELPEQVRRNIENYWNEVVKDNPNLWNGEVTCVTDYIENDNEIEVICKRSDYAHYIYDERVGLSKGLECFNIAARMFIRNKRWILYCWRARRKYIISILPSNLGRKCG